MSPLFQITKQEAPSFCPSNVCIHSQWAKTSLFGRKQLRIVKNEDKTLKISVIEQTAIPYILTFISNIFLALYQRSNFHLFESLRKQALNQAEINSSSEEVTICLLDTDKTISNLQNNISHLFQLLILHKHQKPEKIIATVLEKIKILCIQNILTEGDSFPLEFSKPIKAQNASGSLIGIATTNKSNNIHTNQKSPLGNDDKTSLVSPVQINQQERALEKHKQRNITQKEYQPEKSNYKAWIAAAGLVASIIILYPYFRKGGFTQLHTSYSEVTPAKNFSACELNKNYFPPPLNTTLDTCPIVHTYPTLQFTTLQDFLPPTLLKTIDLSVNFRHIIKNPMLNRSTSDICYLNESQNHDLDTHQSYCLLPPINISANQEKNGSSQSKKFEDKYTQLAWNFCVEFSQKEIMKFWNMSKIDKGIFLAKSLGVASAVTAPIKKWVWSKIFCCRKKNQGNENIEKRLHTIQSVAEQAKTQAEQAKIQAEKSRLENERAKTDAEKLRLKIELTKIEIDPLIKRKSKKKKKPAKATEAPPIPASTSLPLTEHVNEAYDPSNRKDEGTAVIKAQEPEERHEDWENIDRVLTQEEDAKKEAKIQESQSTKDQEPEEWVEVQKLEECDKDAQERENPQKSEDPAQAPQEDWEFI